MVKKTKIAIVGLGYVGLSISMLLSKEHDVVAFDVNQKKIKALTDGISTLDDIDIQEYLSLHKKSNSDMNGSFLPTNNKYEAFKDSEYVVIATPTDYDVKTNYFDTSSIEEVIQDVISINANAVIIIKSTIPVGYTISLKEKYNKENIIFSPEFLREGSALYDNLHPSRIIIGDNSSEAKKFAMLLAQGAIKKNIDILYTGSKEAEAIKLFSNTYLAMRITYFNELDTYAEISNLDSKQIIEGIGLDSRIGLHYNNPSFGYGGYCLPKDTRQLSANFTNIPNKIIDSIHNANEVRKDFIAQSIINKKPKTIGIYRLIMKSGSDNFRDSAILGIIKRLQRDSSIEIILYEPFLLKQKGDNLLNIQNIKDLNEFKHQSEIIVTNRMTNDLDDVIEKVYTRDIFNAC
jgi:UDPglucose 6-dehydrogenase